MGKIFKRKELANMSTDEFTDALFGADDIEYDKSEVVETSNKKAIKSGVKPRVFELFDTGDLNNVVIDKLKSEGITLKDSTVRVYRSEWLKDNEGNSKYITYKENLKSSDKRKGRKPEKSKEGAFNKTPFAEYTLKNNTLSIQINKELNSKDIDKLIKLLEGVKKEFSGE